MGDFRIGYQNVRMEEHEIKTIEELTHTLFTLLHVPGEISVSALEETVRIDISGENLGVLIGYHGETLYSLQTLIGILIQRNLGRYVPVSLEVGDWRAQREARLQEIVDMVVQLVRETGVPQALHPMDAAERRMVHILAGNYPDLSSESEGEGRDRRVVIRLAREDPPLNNQ